MNELNWYWAYTPYLDTPDKQAESAVRAGYDKVIFKSEADSVIAELEDKLKAADMRNDKLVSKASDMLTLKDKETFELDCELRQQKYKRCLDKAKWCDERIARYQLQQAVQGILWQSEIKFYRRLKNKYIEIAKQFKEPICDSRKS